MSKKNSITDLTRRNIFDYLMMERVAWAGRLEEPQFIVRVWPNAADLPSYDTRYKDALGDIHQHLINNYDWDDDWIFGDARFNLTGGSDEQFVAFLSEMVHPVVRLDEDEVAKLVAEFNRQLRPDGYQLKPATYLSGKPIYAGARVTASHSPATALRLPTRTLLDDHSALMDHLDAIERDLASDPAGVIASAKSRSRSFHRQSGARTTRPTGVRHRCHPHRVPVRHPPRSRSLTGSRFSVGTTRGAHVPRTALISAPADVSQAERAAEQNQLRDLPLLRPQAITASGSCTGALRKPTSRQGG